MAGRRGERGQALVLLVGSLMAIVAGAAALAWLAAGLVAAGQRQRAADLGALAGARALLDTRLRGGGPPAEEIARATAVRNGARAVSVTVSAGGWTPRVTVVVSDPIRGPGGVLARGRARAVAEPAGGVVAGDGTYSGPLAERDGKPMRPDVALAYDRLSAAANAAGHRLVVESGWRSDAEQARLFAARPDPRWVAPPGRSLHRLGTELDLGPRTAYRWLAVNAERFGFTLRYPWEPWHFGFVRSPGSASVGFSTPRSTDGAALPAWVPAAYAGAIRGASIRHGVGAALLAAQLRQESGFDARAVSRAGARGIAQFMPGTASSYGLRNPFDAEAAIDAQARLMADLLRRFGSVPLALAAYNAGPGVVGVCWCVPAIAETRAYVAAIVALVTARGGGGAAPPVRLVA
jgi:hypothetical protein